MRETASLFFGCCEVAVDEIFKKWVHGLRCLFFDKETAFAFVDISPLAVAGFRRANLYFAGFDFVRNVVVAESVRAIIGAGVVNCWKVAGSGFHSVLSEVDLVRLGAERVNDEQGKNAGCYTKAVKGLLEAFFAGEVFGGAAVVGAVVIGVVHCVFWVSCGWREMRGRQ